MSEEKSAGPVKKIEIEIRGRPANNEQLRQIEEHWEETFRGFLRQPGHNGLLELLETEETLYTALAERHPEDSFVHAFWREKASSKTGLRRPIELNRDEGKKYPPESPDGRNVLSLFREIENRVGEGRERGLGDFISDEIPAQLYVGFKNGFFTEEVGSFMT